MLGVYPGCRDPQTGISQGTAFNGGWNSAIRDAMTLAIVRPAPYPQDGGALS
jgi:hypothetical protein